MTSAGEAAAAPRSAPFDEHVQGLIQGRFDRLVADWPVMATYLGIHEHDGRLADLSREAKEADIAAERAHVAALGAVDPGALSPRQRFEWELAVHSARRRLFDAEVHRAWERRPSASDEVGDGLFLLLARQFEPLDQRLVPMTEQDRG